MTARMNHTWIGGHAFGHERLVSEVEHFEVDTETFQRAFLPLIAELQVNDRLGLGACADEGSIELRNL